MKKFVYLCGMMLLCMNMMAQIDLNDQNWDWNNSFIEEFNTSRTWDPSTWISMPDMKWKALSDNHVIHDTLCPNIYQYDHCVPDLANGVIKLVSEYAPERIRNHQYDLPNGEPFPNNGPYQFLTGALRSLQTFRYGYFEIRCKLPVHRGAFPSFWMHDSGSQPGNSFYESLDIFEYTWYITVSGENPNPPGEGNKRCYTCGIHFNDTTNHSSNEDRFGKAYPMIPSWCTDLDNFHTFSCEWMPDHVIWYFDGVEMNRYDNPANIPHRPHFIRATYNLDGYYNHNNIIWQGTDEMVIDYIKVRQLKWDCATDEVITCQSDLNGFDYAVKESISITSTLGESVVSSSDKKTFRVTDSFVVTGPFTVNNGAEFTVIKQMCPPDE